MEVVRVRFVSQHQIVYCFFSYLHQFLLWEHDYYLPRAYFVNGLILHIQWNMVGKTQTSNVQNPPKSVLFWTSVSAKKMANNSLIFPLFKSQNCHAFLVLVSDFDTSGHFNHKACFMQSNHIQAFRNCLRFLEPCLPPHTTVRDLMDSQSNQRFFHKNYELLAYHIIVGKAEGFG